jgi:hypothetical protein
MLPIWALGAYGVTSATALLRGGFCVFVQHKNYIGITSREPYIYYKILRNERRKNE